MRGFEPNGSVEQRAWDETPAGWPDREVGGIAANQRSLLTHNDLLRLGISGKAISRALARGRLHRLHHGVYSLVPPKLLLPLAHNLAAVLACGPSALLSHLSAAAVWNIVSADDHPVEVTVVGRDAGRRRAGIRVHRVGRLPKRDRRVHLGIPITSPARTLLDVARHLPERQLERAINEALVLRLTSRTALMELVKANRGRPGTRRLAQFLEADLPGGITRSEAEEEFLALVREAKLPEPELNVRLGAWEVDFLWGREGLVVEIDGYAFHATRMALERDHRKDAALQGRGLVVLRFSPRVVRSWRYGVVAAVAGALARRA